MYLLFYLLCIIFSIIIFLRKTKKSAISDVLGTLKNIQKLDLIFLYKPFQKQDCLFLYKQEIKRIEQIIPGAIKKT